MFVLNAYRENRQMGKGQEAHCSVLLSNGVAYQMGAQQVMKQGLDTLHPGSPRRKGHVVR